MLPRTCSLQKDLEGFDGAKQFWVSISLKRQCPLSDQPQQYKFPPISPEEQALRNRLELEWNEFIKANLGSQAVVNVKFSPMRLYPLDESVKPITKPTDVVWLARKLIAWEGVRELLRKVGEHGDLSYEENCFIEEVLAFLAKPFRLPGHYAVNLNIAVALARKFASGAISEDDDEAAMAFAADRIRTFSSPNWPNADVKPPKISELMQIFQNIKDNHPDVIAQLVNVRQMDENKKWKKFHSINDLKVNGLANKEAMKYGLANRNCLYLQIIETVLAQYAWGTGPKNLERDAIISELRVKHMMFRGRRQLIDDVSS